MRRLEKEGAFAPTRSEFLLSSILYLLELLVSFKTSEDVSVEYIDDALTNAAPRLVRKPKKDEKQAQDKKSEINENFMETLKSFAVANVKRIKHSKYAKSARKANHAKHQKGKQ